MRKIMAVSSRKCTMISCVRLSYSRKDWKIPYLTRFHHSFSPKIDLWPKRNLVMMTIKQTKSRKGIYSTVSILCKKSSTRSRTWSKSQKRSTKNFNLTSRNLAKISNRLKIAPTLGSICTNQRSTKTSISSLRSILALRQIPSFWVNSNLWKI